MYWSFIKPTQREFYTSNDDGFGGRRLRKTGFEQNNVSYQSIVYACYISHKFACVATVNITLFSNETLMIQRILK